MICLDTNYLISGLIDGSREAHELVAWTRAGEPLITPILAWFEFRCGPVTAAQIAAMRAFLEDIVVLDETQVIEAARLFNAVGRKRALRVDAVIASTAMVAGARLATNNRSDFAAFVPFGLQLV